MRTCVVGAGAIGGLLGADLAMCGIETTLVDYGRRLEAIRDRGITVVDPEGGSRTTRSFRTAGSCLEAGPHDLVLLAVKAYTLPHLAEDLPHLFHPETVVLTLQNGIPWWYFQRHGGEWDGRPLGCSDPDGRLRRSVEARRILGCVAYPAAALGDAGEVRHVEGSRFALGELDGEITPRLEAVASFLGSGRFRFRPIPDIRGEIWLKALGSVSLNPVSALTGATIAGVLRMSESRALIRTLMTEAEQVAVSLGIQLRRSVEERMAGAEQVGEHRTSMLQDLEKGERLEIDALVSAVVEMGRLTGSPTPSIEAMEACLRLLEGTRGAAVSMAREASGATIGNGARTHPGTPADQVRIRPMEPTDIEPCMAILSAWNMAPTPEREDAERSGILVENAFVAEYQGRVVGTAGWFPLSERLAETASLAVERGCRGLGVGRLLQDARLEAMRARGFRKVRTETDRPETIRWYKEKFGYREVGRNPKKHPFSRPDVDEWTVLELDL